MPGTPIDATQFESYDLELADAFTIARGSTETTTTHIVTIQDEAGRVGIGGSGPSAYYDETPESVEATLPELLEIVESVGDPYAQQVLDEKLRETAPGEAAARAAVSIAIHDLAARQRGEPLYEQWGLDPTRTPVTSYTVGIDSPAGMADRARAATERGFPVLKVKLGTDDDEARLTAIREVAPDARIRVDANCAWDVEETVDNVEWLQKHDVEFVEQPVPADDVAGLREISERVPIPIAADESCVTAADVPVVGDAVDIVVVKLMKCGGIRPALRQIEAANAHGLDVMLGCMVESNASIAGACHLSPLVEYADLDGSLLLESDPVTGLNLEGGAIELGASSVGTGTTH